MRCEKKTRPEKGRRRSTKAREVSRDEVFAAEELAQLLTLAQSEEVAMKIVMGASLWLSPEESLQTETLELVRRFDEQADQDDEPGPEAILIVKAG